MKRNKSVRITSAVARLGILILLGTAALDGTGPASAQYAPFDDGTLDPSPDPDDDVGPTRAYFQPFPDEAGALTYDDLSAREQEAVMLMGERTDYGPDVHAAWSAVARTAAAEAAARRAGYASGINGIDDVGVQ